MNFNRWFHGSFPNWRWILRVLALVLIFGILVYLIVVSLFTSLLYYHHFQQKLELTTIATSNRSESLLAGDRKLVLILPVNRPSPELCKVVSSAIALGYPAPIIVNWEKDFHIDNDSIGPSHLKKITGTLNFLNWATSDDGERLEEDDLVLILDAHDVWLQLPPSVMLHRYFESNTQANKRITKELGSLNGNPMRQTIIAAAQKGCVAPRDKISVLHCRNIPDSPLPDDVFGFFTDYKISYWKYMRPKFLNSGSFMGPAGDMRRYFQRAKDKMDKGLGKSRSPEDLAGDQGIFAEVFGEQELWRWRIKEGISVGNNPSEYTKLSALNEFEYHIGLDYTQELFYPTCYSEASGSFVSLSNLTDLEMQSSRAGVSTLRIKGIPNDIYNTDGPFATLFEDMAGEYKTWDDMPLYIDFWTTSIPVAIHHNAWRDGAKSRITTWWDKTWYFPHLRNLLELRLWANSSAPLASIEAEDGVLKVWPYGANGTGIASSLFGRSQRTKRLKLRGADLSELCESSERTLTAEPQWYNEVFRDGKGSL